MICTSFKTAYYNGLDTQAAISIPLPRGGQDLNLAGRYIAIRDFNPLAPWGARRPPEISIIPAQDDFNPLAPWGARRLRESYNVSNYKFQSPCPVGGKTQTTCSNN